MVLWMNNCNKDDRRIDTNMILIFLWHLFYISENTYGPYEISCSHGGENVDCGLLCCDTIQLDPEDHSWHILPCSCMVLW